jgi:gliding motility-associated-like protein
MRKSLNFVFLRALACLPAIFFPCLLDAQYEYLSTMNYNNLALTQVGNIPGVGWVEVDNTTYDANHQRFFFLGGALVTGPWRLYTINAVAGSTVSSPLCPPGGASAGQVVGLQYDNTTDTIYGLYLTAGSATLLVWIDTATGIPHTISSLTNFSGYSESTFDTRDNIYILSGNGEITGLNASTGAVVYQFSIPNVYNLEYDNLNNELYGVEYGYSGVYFDSLSLLSGTVIQIGSLPPMSFVPIGRAIDEQNGKFVFVAGNTVNPSCIMNSMYVVDISTGALLSQSIYPYAQDIFGQTFENYVQFSFDNKRGVLYGLNWDPPYPKPAFRITGVINSLCGGSTETFTASALPGSTNAIYQWEVNGINAGPDTSVFTSNSLAPGDTVRCIFSGIESCTIIAGDTSNSVTVSSITAMSASVSITTPTDTICEQDKVGFTAHAVNTGTIPTYQWQVNNLDVGTDDSVFSSSTLANGSEVRCIISSAAYCPQPKSDTSNLISITANSGAPSVTISASATTICSGDTVFFIATPLNDGGSPAVQWLINGSSTGPASDTLVSSTLANSDMIDCILTISPGCTVSVPSSDSITMVVNPSPIIQFDPDTLVIKPGETTTLNPVVTGNVSSYQWSPTSGLDNPSVLSPKAGPSATTVYELDVVGNDGCKAAGKTTVIVYRPLEMPNAFTPNGDGKNDVFRVPAGTPQLIESFAVFNRWGELVYKTTNGSQGWDGTFKGQLQPPGTYVWIVMYEDLLTRQRQVAKGTVVLIK